MAVMGIERNCSITLMHRLLLQNHFVSTALSNQLVRKLQNRPCGFVTLIRNVTIQHDAAKIPPAQSRIIQPCHCELGSVETKNISI